MFFFFIVTFPHQKATIFRRRPPDLKAISLCSLAVKRHLMPVFVVEADPHFSSADAAFGLFGVAQTVQRQVGG